MLFVRKLRGCVCVVCKKKKGEDMFFGGYRSLDASVLSWWSCLFPTHTHTLTVTHTHTQSLTLSHAHTNMCISPPQNAPQVCASLLLHLQPLLHALPLTLMPLVLLVPLVPSVFVAYLQHLFPKHLFPQHILPSYVPRVATPVHPNTHPHCSPLSFPTPAGGVCDVVLIRYVLGVWSSAAG